TTQRLAPYGAERDARNDRRGGSFRGRYFRCGLQSEYQESRAARTIPARSDRKRASQSRVRARFFVPAPAARACHDRITDSGDRRYRAAALTEPVLHSPVLLVKSHGGTAHEATYPAHITGGVLV